MGSMDAIVKEFLVESCEGLDQMDQDLVVLEKDPHARDVLDGIFRTVHTIKGTAGLLGYSKLVAVSHVGESLLSRLRDGALVLTPEIATVLLAMVDLLREMLGSVEATGQDGDADYAAMIADLTRLAETAPADLDAPLAPAAEEMKDADARHAEQSSLDESPSPLEMKLADDSGAQPNRVVAPAPTVDTTPEKELATGAQATSDSTIRVDVGLLDKLMNLTGELVLARNRILQLTAAHEGSALHSSSQHLNLVTSDLQENVMKVRMQPIRNIWGKFPRIVRDLAASRGKVVRIEMEGEETELDKTLLETVRDPLTHLVRNAVDHGIEMPERREAAGKPPEGQLSLHAFHEGGHVNIQISDDGRGIDPERLKNTALGRGLITAADAAELDDRAALELMFLPGFSTAESVTDISGRGVGMDVVRTNIEKIGGIIDIQSVPTLGTSFHIKIPLTLAIIPALIVTCDGERYAIPQVSLHELVGLKGEQARQAIEMIHSAPVFRLRGNLVPLVYLRQVLGLQVPPATSSIDVLNIVVLEANSRQFGLVVDEISDTLEIVTKPLDKQLKDIACYAGATIMGDGGVALILDVVGLAQRAKLISDEHKKLRLETGAAHPALPLERQPMLLVEVRSGDPLALPLDQVAQLEKFPRSAVERAGTQNVVQYRDGILPLVDLASLLPNQPAEEPSVVQTESQNLQVVVCSQGTASVGLVVQRILDIVEIPHSVPGKPSWEASLGSAVIHGRVTDLIDLERAIGNSVQRPQSEKVLP